MVHGIHAGEFRTQPLIAVGFDTSLHDHRDLRFPGKLRDCTRCHDKSEVRSHMVRTGGASLSALQQDIGTRVVERCDNCHGPGTDKSVRKAHEIGSSGGSGDD